MARFNIVIFKIWYAFSLLFLSIYTYTQIDLNLTLSSHPLYQNIQKQLIFIAIYQRPFSASLLAILLLILFLNYFIILKCINLRIFKLKDIIHLIIITVLVLLFSYPAFSYDIFNYIFDARIVAKYHLNPYFYKALDFPNDLWTRFMHWTHRTYPYGPVWLLLTMPVYYLGFGKFVLTLFNFKLFFSLGYVLNIYFIYKNLKILKASRHTGGSRNTKDSPGVEESNILFHLSFFAFNPLIIIEALASPHNEIFMLLLFLLSLYFLLKRKKSISYITLLLSSGIKYLTIILLPFYYLFLSKKITIHSFLKYEVIVLGLLLIPLIILREPYSWYLITIIGVSSLIEKSRIIRLFIIALSAALLSRYLPFIYFGDYKDIMKSWQIILPLIILSFTISLYFLKSKRLFPL